MRIRIYDNDGATADRYAVYFQTGRKKWDLFTMSPNCDRPDGVCMYGGNFPAAFKRTGELVSFKEVPATVKAAIRRIKLGVYR